QIEMTITTTLQQEKVKVPVQPAKRTGATCSIDGGIIRRLIVIAYFLGLTLPTIAVFIIPDARFFLVYSVYLFLSIIFMVPTSLIYLASIDSRLVIYRSSSGNIRVKFTPITPVVNIV
ncbi:hypothetical protein PENTCL1PPCAC_21204, partial [Pristionchus entomophagus]